jgi:large-conductance mechanosensitive channel
MNFLIIAILVIVIMNRLAKNKEDAQGQAEANENADMKHPAAFPLR